MVTPTRSGIFEVSSGIVPVHPKEFFAKWVSHFYGIEAGEYGFKRACADLVDRELGALQLSQSTVLNTWKWDDPGRENFPRHLPALLGYVDRILEIRRLVESSRTRYRVPYPER